VAEGSPLFSVFGTDFGEPAGWLATPRAVQRVLLRARAARVWSSLMDRPIEVGDVEVEIGRGHRPAGRLSATAGALRIHATGQAEPRRAVDEVLVEETS
jgi:hypothetical protein